MRRKAEFNITGMLVGILAIGLFFSVISLVIYNLGGGYDISDFNYDDIKSLTTENISLSQTIQEQADRIDNTVADPSWYDVLGGFFDQLTIPFKTIYNSFKIIGSMSSVAVSELQLLAPFKEFFVTLLTVLVVIGIVMIKHFFGRNN